ncbi:MAG TPA: hypothetical protein VEU30_14315, partial [Thermoanaerobaculia bacterium]|nr:hypothetical protein [Thermoanaerobaculia bacterium]
NTGTYPHCPTSTCLPRMLPAEYGARLREQFAAMVEFAHTDSELATNADTTLGGGFPTFFFWLPDCYMHEGVNQDWSFFDTGIAYLGTTTWMSEFVEDFWLAGRADPPQWFVHGWTDPMGNAMTKDCP